MKLVGYVLIVAFLVYGQAFSQNDSHGYNLSKYVDEALLYSLEWQSATQTRRAEIARARSVYHYYVPTFSASPEYSYDADTWSYDASLSENVPYGGSVALRYTNSMSDPNSVSLELSQPLLKDFGLNAQTKMVKQAKIDKLIAEQDYEQAVLGIITTLIDTYWDLYLAKQDMRIKNQSYEKSKEQFMKTKEHIEKGVLPKSSIYVVEESMIQFERMREEAKESLRSRESAFKKYITAGGTSSGNAVIALLDKPTNAIALNDTKDHLKQRVYEHNPEFLSQKYATEKAELDLKYIKNQLYPNLDVYSAVSSSGLSDYGFNFGLRFSLPVMYTYLKEDYIAANSELNRSKTDLQKIERDMLVEFDDRYNDFLLNQKQYELSKRISELSAKKLETEEEKYKRGLTTLNDLVIFQKDLDSAKSDEESSLIAWHQSYYQLYEMIGELGGYYGIDVKKYIANAQ